MNLPHLCTSQIRKQRFWSFNVLSTEYIDFKNARIEQLKYNYEACGVMYHNVLDIDENDNLATFHSVILHLWPVDMHKSSQMQPLNNRLTLKVSIWLRFTQACLWSCHIFRKYSLWKQLTGDVATVFGTTTMGWWYFLYCCFATR